MIRRALVLMMGIGLAVGMSAAGHDEQQHESVRLLAARDIVEEVDGKEATATAVEVTLGLARAGAPHRHPGPAFGYVLEGEYEWAIDDNPATVLKAGDTFYEPAGCLHRVSRNPSARGEMRMLAWVIHPRDARELATPEPEK